jgi:hypothetical protein
MDLFPDLKFLLIDPNFHSFEKYKYIYVYQNISRISFSNFREFKRQLRKIEKKNKYSKRHKHQQTSAKHLLDVEFLNEEEHFNVLMNVELNLHHKILHKKVTKIMDKFHNNRYNTLIKDIFNSKQRVFIIQDYMSYDLTKKIKQSIENYKKTNQLSVFFLSDIRSVAFAHLFKSNLNGPNDLDYLWNYALQIIFLKVLRPDYSMLKFRPMFFNDMNSDVIKFYSNYSDTSYITDNKYNIFDIVKKDLDIVKKEYGIDMFQDYKNKKLQFFENDFNYIQAWAPRISTESRLFISRNNIDNIVYYDSKDWDNKFYYMRLYRMYSYNPIFYEILKNYKYLLYDGCYDCYREIMIIGNYLLNQHQTFDKYIDVKGIQQLLKNTANVVKLTNIYRLINRYVFFDVSPTYKCPFNSTIINYPGYIIINKYIMKQNYFILIGIKVNENIKQVTVNDVIYAYKIYDKIGKKKKRKIIVNYFKPIPEKGNLYLELK